MRKLRKLLAALAVILLFAVPVFAAGSVPSSVLNATKSVVRVFSEYTDGWATGSGFVISHTRNETLIATNYHVVEGKPQNIYVWTDEANDLTAVTVETSSLDQDLCILRLSGSYKFKALPLKTTAAQGDVVYAVGFPGAADNLSDEIAHTSADATITDGIISAVRTMTISRSGSPVSLYQISAPINHGNSGGPLMDNHGNVVGINTYGIADAEGVNGAISVAELTKLAAASGITLHQDYTWIYAVMTGAAVLCLMVFLLIRVLHTRRRSVKKQPAITLRSYMTQLQHGLSPEQAVSMLIPAAVALRKMHDDGIPHLQISPDSILISAGKASLKAPEAGENNRYSNGFAAPEIYKGKTSGHLSDIYSFCAVLRYAVTGQAPENALSRSEAEPETADGNEFQALLDKGMALEPTDRYATMQELILQLTPYNTMAALPEYSSVESVQTVRQPRKERKKLTKKQKVRIKMALALVLIAIVAVGYVLPYFASIGFAKVGKFEVAQNFLYLPQVTQIHDPNLQLYIDAGVLLEQKKYDEALTILSQMVKYRDSAELENECNYQYAIALANGMKYEDAVERFSHLSELDYKDSAARLLESKADMAIAFANRTYDVGFYSNRALNVIEELKKSGYACEDAEKKVNAAVYANAAELCKENAFEKALALFTRLGEYKDSNKYISLCRLGLGKEIDKYYDEVVSNIEFANTKMVLVSKQAIAQRFLAGMWREKDSGYFFNMSKEGVITHNLQAPYLAASRCIIVNGNVLQLVDNSSSTYSSSNHIFDIAVMAEDTIRIYIPGKGPAGGQLYKLERIK